MLSGPVKLRLFESEAAWFGYASSFYGVTPKDAFLELSAVFLL